MFFYYKNIILNEIQTISKEKFQKYVLQYIELHRATYLQLNFDGKSDYDYANIKNT